MANGARTRPSSWRARLLLLGLALGSGACGGRFLTSLDDASTPVDAGSRADASTKDGGRDVATHHDAPPATRDATGEDRHVSGQAEASVHDARLADSPLLPESGPTEASGPALDAPSGDAHGQASDAHHDSASADAARDAPPEPTSDAAMIEGCPGTCFTCPAGQTCTKSCGGGDCTFDCSGGGMCQNACQGGTCGFKCPAGSHCANLCQGGNCTFDCGPGATCANACEGGSCTFLCPAGATCKNACQGGGCTFDCETGSVCMNTCGGGSCTFECDSTKSTCMDSCNGGLCRGP